MLVTLIPLFDENMSVCAYSLFTQKGNQFLNTALLNTAFSYRSTEIPGMDLINQFSAEVLAEGKKLMVSVNNISIFTDFDETCEKPVNNIVLLLNPSIVPEESYINRIRALKEKGFLFAMRKLVVSQYELYAPILHLMDYIFVDCKKVDVEKAKIYFANRHKDANLCIGNIDIQEEFERYSGIGPDTLYEGNFYRIPVTKGETDVSPIKANYIDLINTVNAPDFELSEAADIIGRDTALVISLLRMVNNMTANAGIKSVRHAAAMLGQTELKKWINTAVANELYSDKPNEVTRLSLIRAKFAENLSGVFDIEERKNELFLMGLFSVLDLILGTTMEEALKIVVVSKSIYQALVEMTGPFAEIYDFIINYESAGWSEISRICLLREIEVDKVYEAYVGALTWYHDLFK